jgi:hypothetical protein
MNCFSIGFFSGLKTELCKYDIYKVVIDTCNSISVLNAPIYIRLSINTADILKIVQIGTF